MAEATWGGPAFDLDAYLARVGLEPGITPTLDNLRALQRAHTAAFPFEYLEMVLGRGLPLDIESIQNRMVGGRRGGCCYDQSVLFAAALEAIGFDVTARGARIRLGAKVLRAVTHGFTTVALDGEEWLTDVGFGGEGMLEPILICDGSEVQQGGWTFGLELEEDDTWVLRSLHGDGWFDLYAFRMEPRYPIDFDMMQHYAGAGSGSVLAGSMVVQRTEDHVRWTLTNNSLSRIQPDGAIEVRQVTVGELPELLDSVFHLTLDPTDAEILVKVFESHR
ncbi:arylamine N-acetyltransferase [Kitasatospora sp. NPDC048239]|uniref:arylamine N-acetyltransferase family protein n=1 Tax=unclassified Kitasatospora TaxID=2633591 RepID=UPI003717BC0E